MISILQKGSFNKTEKFLKKTLGRDYMSILHEYGQKGVDALRAATPKDTGNTANSWSYSVVQNGSSISVVWENSNINHGVNIAVILDKGHATRTGGYVRGAKYIDAALTPIINELAQAAWKEVVTS